VDETLFLPEIEVQSDGAQSDGDEGDGREVQRDAEMEGTWNGKQREQADGDQMKGGSGKQSKDLSNADASGSRVSTLFGENLVHMEISSMLDQPYEAARMQQMLEHVTLEDWVREGYQIK
jgi:hypothetical protein